MQMQSSNSLPNSLQCYVPLQKKKKKKKQKKKPQKTPNKQNDELKNYNETII